MPQTHYGLFPTAPRLLPGLLPNLKGLVGTENDTRARNCTRIRTLREATETEFQDRCLKPLDYPSSPGRPKRCCGRKVYRRADMVPTCGCARSRADDLSLCKRWLGREDSNLRMAESKSAALPLGYAPTRREAGWARRKAGRTIVRALPHRNGCPMDLRTASGSDLFYVNVVRSALAPQTSTPTRSLRSGR